MIDTALFTGLAGALFALLLQLVAGKYWLRCTVVFSSAFLALFLIPTPFEPLETTLQVMRAALPFVAAQLAAVFAFQALLAGLFAKNEA